MPWYLALSSAVFLIRCFLLQISPLLCDTLLAVMQRSIADEELNHPSRGALNLDPDAPKPLIRGPRNKISKFIGITQHRYADMALGMEEPHPFPLLSAPA